MQNPLKTSFEDNAFFNFPQKFALIILCYNKSGQISFAAKRTRTQEAISLKNSKHWRFLRGLTFILNKILYRYVTRRVD